jgi:hypothetical protein
VHAERDSGPVDARKWDRVHRMAATIGPDGSRGSSKRRCGKLASRACRSRGPDGSKWTYHRHDA